MLLWVGGRCFFSALRCHDNLMKGGVLKSTPPYACSECVFRQQ